MRTIHEFLVYLLVVNPKNHNHFNKKCANHLEYTTFSAQVFDSFNYKSVALISQLGREEERT